MRQYVALWRVALIERVSGTAQHIANLVPNQILNFGAGWSEIFAWVELFGIFGESFAQSSRHRQAQVGVDIYFGAASATGDLNVGLRDAGGVGAHFAAVLIDFLNE